MNSKFPTKTLQLIFLYRIYEYLSEVEIMLDF
jgi:hypothetical protein